MKKIAFIFIFTAILTHTHSVYASVPTTQTAGVPFTIVCEPGTTIVDMYHEDTPVDVFYNCGEEVTLNQTGLYYYTEYISFPTTFTVDDTFFVISAPISNSTWGTDNGFWGSTTPSTIISDMTASVQDTGTNLWPLFAMVGIPVAFFIALMLVSLINNQLTPPKNKKKDDILNEKGEEFISHSVDDLEFKREYGQTKRGRGRPRKNPIP